MSLLKKIYCPEHNVLMIRRESKFGNKWWYGCPEYPNCDVTATQDKGGRMIDYPAGGEIKAMRRKAHDLLEKVFGAWEDKKGSRNKMYAWLKTKTKSGHIGHASKKELERVIKLLEREL